MRIFVALKTYALPRMIKRATAKKELPKSRDNGVLTLG